MQDKAFSTWLLQNGVPYKNVAAALLFALIFGPVGLLYSSFWGGIIMILIGIVVCSSKLFFPILLLWIASCIWAVRACEKYNRRMTAGLLKLNTE